MGVPGKSARIHAAGVLGVKKMRATKPGRICVARKWYFLARNAGQGLLYCAAFTVFWRRSSNWASASSMLVPEHTAPTRSFCR